MSENSIWLQCDHRTKTGIKVSLSETPVTYSQFLLTQARELHELLIITLLFLYGFIFCTSSICISQRSWQIQLSFK